MPDISRVQEKYDNAIKSKNQNDKDLSPTHESSLLYQTDVQRTQTVLEGIQNSCGKDAYDSFVRCANFSDGAQSTGIKGMASNLTGLSGEMDSAIHAELQTVLEKIKTASLDVYGIKKIEYENNTNSIINLCRTYGEHRTSFDNNVKKYNAAKTKRDSAESGSDEYNQAQDDMNHYERNAKSDYEVCDNCATQIEKINEKNRQLLDEFLKTF